MAPFHCLITTKAPSASWGGARGLWEFRTPDLSVASHAKVRMFHAASLTPTACTVGPVAPMPKFTTTPVVSLNWLERWAWIEY